MLKNLNLVWMVTGDLKHGLHVIFFNCKVILHYIVPTVMVGCSLWTTPNDS